MTKQQSSVFIDANLVSKALKRAKKKNLPRNLRRLLDYLINLYIKGEMPVDFDPSTFSWTASKRTSMTYEKHSIALIQDKLKAESLPSTYEFIVNFLLTNFLKNTD